MFGPKELTDKEEKTLEQLGIINNSTITMVGRVHGGGLGKAKKIKTDLKDFSNVDLSS